VIVSRSSKIFLILTGVLFLCGSLEIDVAGYHNTFFDPYDTYIHTDSDAGTVIEHHSHAAPIILDLNELISAWNIAAMPQMPGALDPAKTYSTQPLFLTHSIWRI
jgi:hypothetical protein